MKKKLTILAGAAALCGAMHAGEPLSAGLGAPIAARPWLPVPDVADRAFWGRQAADLGYARPVLERAAKLAREKNGDPSDALYHEFAVNGNRTRYQAQRVKLEDQLDAFTLAYLLTRDRERLQRIVGILRRFCAMRSWLLPAHDRDEMVFNGQREAIDLGSALVSWRLATVRRLLLPDLPPALADALRKNIERRTLNLFRAAVTDRQVDVWWLRMRNNWNAVCLTGVMGTALALEDDYDRRLWLADQCVRFVGYSLAAFAADGYCSEGVGYWNYGFGHNLRMALLAYGATGGRVNLLDRPESQPPLRYPRHVPLTPRLCPAFADCRPDQLLDPQLLNAIDFLQGRRATVAAPGFVAPAIYDQLLFVFSRHPDNAPAAKGARGAPAERPPQPPLSRFPDAGVVVARPGGTPGKLSVAFKGGSNHELHNHNDVGEFIVAVGDAPLLADPGNEVYTARTFGPRRYESKVLNSFGHMVPEIDGQLQVAGEGTDAKVLAEEETPETFRQELDLLPAYRVPGLTTLRREFFYDRRGGGSFRVTDVMEAERPLAFAVPLVTFDEFAAAGGKVSVRGRGEALTVQIDAGGMNVAFEETVIDEEMPAPPPPRRLALRLAPATRVVFTLRMTPGAD